MGGATHKKLFPVLIGLCLFLAGCDEVYSLFTLYDDESVMSNDALLGRWQQIEKDAQGNEKVDTCCWVFAKDEKDKHKYLLTIPDDNPGEAMVSVVHLAKLGDAWFVDVESPSEDELKTNRVPFPFLNVHLIGRIWIEMDSVRMEFIDKEEFKKAEVSGHVRLTYVNPNDDIVLTGTTEQLQAFAREHAEDKQVFSTEFILRRPR